MFAGFATAAEPNHPANPPSHADIHAAYLDGTMDIDDLRLIGLSVFTTPFNIYDGFGDGPFDPGEDDTRAFGQRPTLQGNGLFLRVNGLDAQSCNECHTIVSNRERPPELGIGGVGGLVQSALILPDAIDVSDSETPPEEAFDGTADYTGRLANPPFLFGGGGVELLAKEMTIDLQSIAHEAMASSAGTVFQLDTHGVNFGTITSLGDGETELNAEGIGFEDNTGRDVADILVVRPFGRKGENFSMRDFDRGAMQFHFGVEPVEIIGEGVDGDGDGVVDEVSTGEMTALHIFDVTNPPPFMSRLNREAMSGFASFYQVGCAGCHIPEIATRSNLLPLAFPEDPADPSSNVYIEIDLRKFGFKRVRGGGIKVPLFSDLKRHKMGPELAETFNAGEIANDEFVTARLWGIADTAPYMHDGRSTTLRDAIEAHGGDAEAARDAFLDLTEEDKDNLLLFLGNLRTPIDPNQDLIKKR
ncbi:MAG TPA: di-heme oxidoredictase family protein [Xanthomonadales bacterium]|nr:di-heme oxidoredictase family protein [Xanthomonadales bacterium]